MSRHHERDRSRDRHGYRGRSQSSDSYDKKKRTPHQSSHHPPPVLIKRRVKFNDISDVKVFRKDDEPNGKGLTDHDLDEYMKKLQAEMGSSSFHNFNWQKMKHRDAQLESNSIKQQKQRQKVLCQKLQSVSQQIAFYSPQLLKVIEELSPGEGSSEREVLSNKLNNVLACFYVQQSQIPGEPAFQIQNRAPSISPKLISFNKQRINNKDLTNNSSIFISHVGKTDKEHRPIKGILKGFSEEKRTESSTSEPRRIDPALITLLKEINSNKAMYSKEKTEILLQPYKLSGELEYLKNNPTVLSSLFRQSEPTIKHQLQPLRSSISPGRMPDPYQPRSSISPQTDRMKPGYPVPHPQNEMGQYPQQYVQYQNYPPYGPYGQYPNYPTPGQPEQQQQIQQYQHMQPQVQQYNPYQQLNNMGRSFKTVPCKYFHSPQGCVKTNGCTFIHDEQYAGKPTPSMLKSNRGMVNSYGQEMGAGMGQPYIQYPGYGDGRQQ